MAKYKSASDRGLKQGEHANAGNGRVLIDAPRGYPGKKYMDGRYAYRSAVEAWRQTGKVADGRKTIVHHIDEPLKMKGDTFSHAEDRKVRVAPRTEHYARGMHGAPGARSKPRSMFRGR